MSESDKKTGDKRIKIAPQNMLIKDKQPFLYLIQGRSFSMDEGPDSHWTLLSLCLSVEGINSVLVSYQ